MCCHRRRVTQALIPQVNLRALTGAAGTQVCRASSAPSSSDCVHHDVHLHSLSHCDCDSVRPPPRETHSPGETLGQTQGPKCPLWLPASALPSGPSFVSPALLQGLWGGPAAWAGLEWASLSLGLLALGPWGGMELGARLSPLCGRLKDCSEKANSSSGDVGPTCSETWTQPVSTSSVPHALSSSQRKSVWAVLSWLVSSGRWKGGTGPHIIVTLPALLNHLCLPPPSQVQELQACLRGVIHHPIHHECGADDLNQERRRREGRRKARLPSQPGGTHPDTPLTQA